LTFTSTALNVEQEIREQKARLDKHDTMLAQLMGQFEFISGKLNAMQRFMHAKFDAIDKRFDAMDKRFDKIESDVGTLREDLPGVVVEAVRSVLRRGSPRRCRLGDPFFRPANQVRACPLAFSLNGFTALSRTGSRRGKPPLPPQGAPAFIAREPCVVCACRWRRHGIRADDELLAARASSDEESAPLALRHREAAHSNQAISVAHECYGEASVQDWRCRRPARAWSVLPFAPLRRIEITDCEPAA
jgi:hypothetical protein